MRSLTWKECLTAKPFTRVIDARSPAEYAENHLPGAINLPVLDDAQRAEIGRIYCQVSRFDARRLGAAMVARNVAAHLESFFAPFPEHSRFLIYCWRGGHRSRSMALILHAVGWDVTVLTGGYKSYRAHVRDALAELGPRLRCRMVAGLTGSGKSRLLRRMAARGQQVLDLEAMGCHRGSLLGDEPDRRQPSQKQFESLLLEKLESFDLTKPVWVESESKRLGRLWLPEWLWAAMLRAQVHEITVPVVARAEYLVQEYPHFPAAPDALITKLDALREACSGRQVGDWGELIRDGKWVEFTASILKCHYDPGYRRSYGFQAPVSTHSLESVDDSALDRVADELLRAGG